MSELAGFESLKLAAGVVLLSPFVPLLFMGEEFGEKAPFQYFTSHSDERVIEAVRRGRREEFAAFAGNSEQNGPPDPQSRATFARSKLDHRRVSSPPHETLRNFYRELIRLRKQVPGLAQPSKERTEARALENDRGLVVRRWSDSGEAFMVFHFGGDTALLALDIPAGRWKKELDSADCRWLGQGGEAPETVASEGRVGLPVGPRSLCLYSRLGAPP